MNGEFYVGENQQRAQLVREFNAGRTGYQLTGEYLGGGGFGKVFVGVDLKTDEQCAIKIEKPPIDDPDARQRLNSEANLMRAWDHPHIASANYVSSFQPRRSRSDKKDDTAPPTYLFMAMDLAKGTLNHAIEQAKQTKLGRLPTLLVTQSMMDITSALAYAHNDGIVHRDVKPSNILVFPGKGLHLKLADWGAAHRGYQSADDVTRTHLGIGTARYAWPGQLEANHSALFRHDIYSLALTAREALTGDYPFKQEKPNALIAAHLMQNVPFIDLKTIDGETDYVACAVQKALLPSLSKDPSHWHPSMSHLGNALYAAVVQELSEQKHSPVYFDMRPQQTGWQLPKQSIEAEVTAAHYPGFESARPIAVESNVSNSRTLTRRNVLIGGSVTGAAAALGILGLGSASYLAARHPEKHHTPLSQQLLKAIEQPAPVRHPATRAERQAAHQSAAALLDALSDTLVGSGSIGQIAATVQAIARYEPATAAHLLTLTRETARIKGLPDVLLTADYAWAVGAIAPRDPALAIRAVQSKAWHETPASTPNIQDINTQKAANRAIVSAALAGSHPEVVKAVINTFQVGDQQYKDMLRVALYPQNPKTAQILETLDWQSRAALAPRLAQANPNALKTMLAKDVGAIIGNGAFYADALCALIPYDGAFVHKTLQELEQRETASYVDGVALQCALRCAPFHPEVTEQALKRHCNESPAALRILALSLVRYKPNLIKIVQAHSQSQFDEVIDLALDPGNDNKRAYATADLEQKLRTQGTSVMPNPQSVAISFTCGVYAR